MSGGPHPFCTGLCVCMLSCDSHLIRKVSNLYLFVFSSRCKCFIKENNAKVGVGLYLWSVRQRVLGNECTEKVMLSSLCCHVLQLLVSSDRLQNSQRDSASEEHSSDGRAAAAVTEDCDAA